MPLIDRESTPELQAASRVNGRESPGPRTAEGKQRSSRNALKHGCYSQFLFESMEALGEDPQDFVQLRDGLLQSHQPASPAEALLVEDLALRTWPCCAGARSATSAARRACWAAPGSRWNWSTTGGSRS